ncbi:hypothetical protein PV341_12315 [Streptomyces sp. PA03-1a]|nr:hypothetical protein [Streptomyces sp. PA03-1a]MDX2817546.1 hypothetical protein [Streptomyces sp. PA03-5A]
MSEREYFGHLARRPGMFVSPKSVHSVMAFIVGYDQAARRHGGRGLDGWREWLASHYQVGSNLIWEAQIWQIAFPGWKGGWEVTTEQEDHVLQVLFELLDKFLSEREARHS